MNTVTERAWGGFTYTITERMAPFSLGVPPLHLLGSHCPPPEERCLLMLETGEKERNYLFKKYTDLD